jgi:hypothetical protein
MLTCVSWTSFRQKYRDHTGVPIHFHSSTTSGSTSPMRARIFASVSPLQSPNSAIFSLMSLEAALPAAFG